MEFEPVSSLSVAHTNGQHRIVYTPGSIYFGTYILYSDGKLRETGRDLVSIIQNLSIMYTAQNCCIRVLSGISAG